MYIYRMAGPEKWGEGGRGWSIIHSIIVLFCMLHSIIRYSSGDMNTYVSFSSRDIFHGFPSLCWMCSMNYRDEINSLVYLFFGKTT